MLVQCIQCGKLYPDELFVGNICIKCGLLNRNEIHGLPAATPFHGPIAASMWAQADEFDEKRSTSQQKRRKG